MATDYSSGKGDGSGSNRSSIRETVIRFFKIVSDTGIDRLRLPTEFTRRYGHILPGCISLKVPSGLVWKVGLIHSNHETWLHEGWQRFREYYSIRLGHFLLFEYVENSLFEVHIFDTSAIEIKYFQHDSLNRVAGLNHVDITERVESESDDSVVFLEEILRKKNVRSKDQDVTDDTTRVNSYIEVKDNNPPSRWREKRTMHESSEQKLGKSSRGEQNTSISHKKESRFEDSSPKYQSDIGIEGIELKYSLRNQVQQQTRDAKTRSKAYKRASFFMSEKPNRNPFSIVEMLPSYVLSRRSCLHIPSAFAKDVIMPDGKNSSILVCEGRTWPVSYIRRKEKANLTSGWGKFVIDNDLKVGDACVFEIVERINLTFNVIIFRL